MKPSGLCQSHPVGWIISAGIGLLGARLTRNKRVFFPQTQQNRIHEDQVDYITSTPLFNDHDITMKLLTNGSGEVQHTTAAPLCFGSFVLSIFVDEFKPVQITQPVNTQVSVSSNKTHNAQSPAVTFLSEQRSYIHTNTMYDTKTY